MSVRRIATALLATGLVVAVASVPLAGSAGAEPPGDARSSTAAGTVVAEAPTAAAAAAAASLTARHSLRAPVTDETFYFVMADRFENGDTDNDKGGISGGVRLDHGFDPTNKGFYQGRRPQGPARQDRLHPGPGHDLDLADPQLQEQGGPAGGRPRPATTATG